jgi:endonuclease/exonuclease/phosphatase family metal-dependent hydrolase
MGLLVAPGPYLGTDREGAIAEIIARIRSLSPDVVGLCEVFSDGERETIRAGVGPTHPHFLEGPDEADLESDGGRLLLSKHPIIKDGQIIYRDCAGNDCYANKGALHMRVQPPGSPIPYDVFYSHNQDIDPDGGTEALYAQMTSIDAMIRRDADPSAPNIVMGDMNIPGEVPGHYDQMIERLGWPIDAWVIGGDTQSGGFTFAAANNFYEDAEDNPRQNRRLDYVLMRAGRRFVPIVASAEVARFTRGGRFISDHFGLHVRFEQAVEIAS